MTFTNSQWQEAEVALANAGGSGGGPVTAVSGAFVAGAIVDLATLLTEFAELLTDTDNLATIATNTSGLATDAHASSIVTNTANIPAKGSAAMAASTPVTIATNDTVLSELLTDTDNLATLVTNTADLLADGDHLATIDTNIATTVPGVQGWIAATGTGTASQDDSLTFASQVRKVVLYNAASVPVPFEFDQTSTATSILIQPGQYMVFDDILCTVVHVFPSALLPINTTSGLYVKGWK